MTTDLEKYNRKSFHKWMRGSFTEEQLKHDLQGIYYNPEVWIRWGAWTAAYEEGYQDGYFDGSTQGYENGINRGLAMGGC